MNAFVGHLSALPFHRLGRHPDVLLAAGVLGILAMLIIPLPAGLLDLFLAGNISFAALILVAAIFARDALKLSSFPALLLISTLYRLALNVSSTRMILAKGEAGEVIRGFGQFVLQGDVVVGFVVFLILTFVQFLVIAKGAERVAEVAARFTLDAMPGKQMSIDAALRSGALTEEEAQNKRDTLGRESQLYGAMDGAMKFVKGDAIAGLVITGINLVAGFAIGVARLNLSFSEAMLRYSILTIGDGLVSQIPALLITLAAGMITTKIAPKEENGSLGKSLETELLQDPRVLGLAAGLALLLSLVPGLPFVPFVGAALLFGGLAVSGVRRIRRLMELETSERQSFERRLERKVEEAKAQKAISDRIAPTLNAVTLELDLELSAALGFDRGLPADSTELLSAWIPKLRDQFYGDTGVHLPGVRVVSHCPELQAGAFTIKFREVPVFQGRLRPGSQLALDTVRNLARVGIVGEAYRHPLTGQEVSLVPPEDVHACESAGVKVLADAGVIALHLFEVARKKARDLVGLQEVAELVERLEKPYPALVKEVMPKLVGLSLLTDIVRRLVDEGVSVRDLKTVFEALAEHAQYETDPVALTEWVRASLAPQIARAACGRDGRIAAVLLDPAIEDTVQAAIHTTAGGSYLALEPELNHAIVQSVMRVLAASQTVGARPVILTQMKIRRYVKKLLETDAPRLTVLSMQELPGDTLVQPIARVTLREEYLAA